MKYIGIIPARYASTRLPGKPLKEIGGRPIIEHVYTRAAELLDEVLVATDDERIERAVRSFGGKVVMTSADHRSGTDRCREAFDTSGSDADVVINIQGDEPFVSVDHLSALMSCFEDPTTQIATPIRAFEDHNSYTDLTDPNTVKVVRAIDGRALYFSRSVIPYLRGVEPKDYLKKHTFYSHLGIYAYRAEVLREITQLGVSPLEGAESLEQLRWLSAGYLIRTAVVTGTTIGIDTENDLIAARAYYDSLQK